MQEAVIAIPTINNLKYLAGAIRSIRCDFPYEVLVIDNGSTDDTQEWLKEKGITTIRHDKNLGVNYANSEAMDYAFSAGKYLFVIHNDVVLHKDCLNNLYHGLEITNYDLLYGLEYMMSTPSESLVAQFNKLGYTYYTDGCGVPDSVDIEYFGVTPTLGINFTVRAIKKSTFDKVGYADINFYPAYFCDNDYGLRCRLGGVKFGLVDTAVYQHFWSRSIHEGGVKTLNDINFSKNEAYYEKKWGGGPTKETKLIPENIKIFRTREEDYELIKGRLDE